MSELLATIASQAGIALVAAATTDLWAGARQRVARLLGRDEPDRRDQMEGWLDTTAAEVAAAPDRRAVERQVQAWSVRLADHLERHPGTAPELDELSLALRRSLPAEGRALIQAIGTGTVSQHRIGGGAVANTGIVIGDVSVDRRRPR